MGINAGYFGDELNFEQRFFPDHQKLAEEVERLKGLNLRVVLTMGSFDILHIGHSRYLKAGKSLGDVLVVGIETDEKVRSRKGPRRPVVPESERIEMVAHTRYADLITIKNKDDPKWHLIKLLRPTVLQAVEGTYTEDEQKELKAFCGDVAVQKRQAETSTSAKIRLLVVDGMETLAHGLALMLPELVVKILKEGMDAMTSQLELVLPKALQETVAKMKEGDS